MNYKRLLIMSLVAMGMAVPRGAGADEYPSPPPTETLSPEAAPTAAPSAKPTLTPATAGTAQRNPQSFNPDISVIPSFAYGYFTGRSLLAGDPKPRTGFNLSELEVGFQAAVDPFFRADIFTTFSPGEGFDVEEAYLTALTLPWNLTARVGKFRSSFGRHNGMHRHVWEYVDVPLVIERVLGGEGFSDLGAQISWLAPAPWFMEANLDIQQGAAGNIFGGKRGRDLLIIGTLKNSWDLGDETTILFGISGASGPNGGATLPGPRSYLLGGDLTLKWRPLRFGTYTGLNWQTEYLFARQEDTSGNTDSGGLYSQVSYKFNEGWIIALRGDLDGWPGPRQRRITVALTNWPSEFSMFRLQYEYRFTSDTVPDPVHGVVVQMQFSIGAHGAHKF